MFVFPHGATVDRDGNLWVTDARGEDGKGHQVFKFDPDGKVLMTLGKAGRQRRRAGSLRSADRRRRRAERRHLRHRQPSQRQEQPRREVHRRTARSSRSGARRDPAPASSASRTRSRWTRAAGCSSATARTTASRSSIRTASSSTEWRQFGRPSGIFITKDDTIYVADSESGPDTGAHELTGIKKGIRIGSAKDRHGDRVHRRFGIDGARSFRRRRRRRRRAGKRLRRRCPPTDARASRQAVSPAFTHSPSHRTHQLANSLHANSPTCPPVCQKSTVCPSTNSCWRTYAMRPAIALAV